MKSVDCAWCIPHELLPRSLRGHCHALPSDHTCTFIHRFLSEHGPYPRDGEPCQLCCALDSIGAQGNPQNIECLCAQVHTERSVCPYQRRCKKLLVVDAAVMVHVQGPQNIRNLRVTAIADADPWKRRASRAQGLCGIRICDPFTLPFRAIPMYATVVFANFDQSHQGPWE